ncbi:MAG: hypothetical protein K5778_09925 [Bacteroidaceae bacterium]|nr:hypothetical protein [Bacteroidaceae bacterium]
MKQIYNAPLMTENEIAGGMLLQTLDVSNTEVEGGLSKGRWDNEDDVKKETDSWTDGLW